MDSKTIPTDGSLRLYFAPLACSLASRIACYEAGAEIEYVQVDTKAKRVSDGGDFFAINPMGQVPVLEIDGRDRLSENAAVLQYLVDRFPEADLGPADGLARSRLQQWLGFIGTELHKAVFVPLLSPALDKSVEADARGRAPLRLEVLERHLSQQDHLLDRYSVADAYLATVLNWAPHAKVELDGVRRSRPIGNGSPGARLSPARCTRNMHCGKRGRRLRGRSGPPEPSQKSHPRLSSRTAASGR